jgi:hypothetical protein
MPDFPLLPIHDVKASSLRALGSIVSSLKSIPNIETWPMTSTSIGLSQYCFGREDVFRVRAHDLVDMWFALPGSGGTVWALEWHRDTGGVAHESVLLRVTANSSKPAPNEDTWWVCLERYPGMHSFVQTQNKVN